MNKEKILIIDDEHDIRSIISDILEDEGFIIETAENAQQGDKILLSFQPDLVLLDIWMPGEDGKTDGNEGLKLLEKWKEKDQLNQPVVMISGHGNVETAVEAVKNGAYDFLEKPLSTTALLLTINRALETNRLRKENQRLKLHSNEQQEFIGASPQIHEVRRQIQLFGPTDSRVLLTGEVGTGKLIAAKGVHLSSKRKGHFVQLNLAATPLENVATRLFGIEFGDQLEIGCFEEAHLGTLFINEILDIDLETQAKLISALQDQRFFRVGGKQFINFDVRIVAATSGNIEQAVSDGKFREDLYFHLNVIPIHIPTLRERKQDIEMIANYHLNRCAQQNNSSARGIDPLALKAMHEFSWPGNVRQLTNIIIRLQLSNPDQTISEQEFLSSVNREAGTTSNTSDQSIPDFYELSMREAKETFETAYLQYQLEKVNNNISQLARNIGMGRTHLYRKLKSLGIAPQK